MFVSLGQPAAQAAQIVGPLWPATSATAAAPKTPDQWSGSAAGKSHRASTENTRATEGAKGKARDTAPNELPAAAIHDHELTPRTSTPAAVVTGTTTSRTPSPEASSFDASRSVPQKYSGDERTEVFRNPDNTYTARMSQDRVRFRQPDGSWAPIDNTLVPDGRSRWRKTADSLDVRIAAQSSDPTLFSLAPDSKHQLSFNVAGAAPATAQVAGDTAIFPNVFPGADVELVASGSGVKESLILHSPETPTTWIFPFTARGLSASMTDTGDVEFTDRSGKVRIQVPGGSMTDSAIDPVSNLGAWSDGVTYRLIDYQGAPALRVDLDTAWLRDPARKYPVVVDPTSTINADTTYVQTTDHTGINHYSDLLNVGSYDNGVHKAVTLLDFEDFEDDFKNNFVRGAWLSLYDAWDGHCTPTEVTVSAIASEWAPYVISYDLAGYPGVKIGARLGSKAFATSPRCLGTAGTANWATIGLEPSTFDQWAHGGTNHGLILTAATNTRTTWKQFASAHTVNRPYLTIDYSPYGVNWTGAPSWSTVPTALTDGVLQVPVQNWGNASWTSTNGYKLRYTQTNAVTGAQLATGTATMPSTVAPRASATVPITIARQPAGSQLRITLDMLAPGDVPFSSWLAPTESFTYIGPNMAPQIDGQAPGSNVTLGSLTPTISATGHDPDNYPGPLQYEFWVCPATATAWPTGCTSSGRQVAGVNAWTIPSGVLAYNKSYYWIAQNYDGLVESYPSAPSWFTTVVGQPVITSHLAQNPDKRGYDPEAGNYTTAATDLTVPGAGLPLAVQRTYNSLDPRSTGAFGAGWWSVFDMRATPDADGTGNVVVTYPNGQAVRFGRNLDGTFTAPEGRYATLTPTGTTGYTLVDKDGTKYVFTGAAPTFRIASITNRAGHGTTFTYQSGRLAKVTNTVSKRSLYLTWDTPSGAIAAHVTSATTDPVSGQGSAITATYTYTGDNLTAACLPNQQQPCTGYTYIAGAHNRSVVLDAAPSSYWRLAEPADTDTATSEVLQNEGSDTAISLDVTFGVAGPASTATAASFDGTSSYVQLPKNLMSGTTFLTVQLWFRTTTSGTAQMLYATGKSPANAANPDPGAMPVLYVGTDNKLHGHFADGTTAGMASPNQVNDGRWHQVTLAGAIGSQALYLDGVQIGATTGQLVNTDPYQFIGAGVFNNSGWPAAPGGNVWSHFQGSIADVAYYPRPLSAIQIASQYEAATTPAALLTKVTLPSGKTAARMVYDTQIDRLTEVTDNNSGTWRVGTPTVAGTSTIYRSAVLGSAPSNYWRLGDAGGSSAANELARSNGVYASTTLGVQGPFGRNDTTAAAFNGTNSHVQMPGNLRPKTVELWFSTTGSGVLFSYSQNPITDSVSGDFIPALYVGTDGKLYGQFGKCQWNEIGNCVVEPMHSSAAVNDGNWHHVALSTDGVNQTLYVDGKSAGSLPTLSHDALPYFAYVGTGFIGGDWPAQPHQSPTDHSGYPTYFTGSIAEVAYYWGPLKTDEVVDHYKAYGNALSHSSPTTRVEVVDPDGNPLNYTYDPYHGGRLVTATDAMNNLTSYGYDTAGFLHTVTDPNREQVFTGHDVRGNVVSRSTCHASGFSCATSYYTYFPDDTSMTLTPDPRNDRVTSFRDGRSADAVDPTYATRYTYNTAGNLLSTVGPPVAGFPAGRTTSTVHTDGTAAFPSFDGGNAPPELPARTTTPGGTVTSYRYYTNGDLAQVTDPAGLVTTYTYDNLGRLLNARQTSDSYPAGLVTSFTYDAAGRQTSSTSPAVTDRVTGAVHTAKTTTDYDTDGNITTQSIDDLAGSDATRTTTYGYDDANRVTSITQPSGAVSRYGYDSFGRRTSVTNQTGTRTDFAFDPAGRQITTTLRDYIGDPSDPSPAHDLVLESRAYDPGGRLASVTDSMGRVTRYTYYDDGRLAETFRPDPASTTGAGYLAETRGYDGAGNLTGVCLRNCGQSTEHGQEIAYRLDAGNRVVSIDTQTTAWWDLPMGVLTDITYDPDDHPVGVTSWDMSDLSPVQRTETTNYTYDPLGRLTSRTVHDPTVTQSAAVSMVGQWNLDDGKITSAVDASGGATAGSPITLAFDGTRYTATKIWTGQSTQLAFQADGNLVIYRNSDHAPLWASGTAGNPDAVLVAQADGNLVIYRDSTFQTALWSTATGGNAGARGALAANGELTITNSGGTPLWSAGTAQTGFNNPGTLSGGAAWSWESPYYNGSFTLPSGGAKFDGATGQVTTPGPVVDTTKSYTISLWAKATSLGSAKQTLAVQQGRQQPGFSLEYQGAKWTFARPTTDTANASTVSAQSTSSATPGVWTHLVGVYDQPTGTMTLYVNGKAQPTAQNTTPFKTTGPLVIGRGFANGAASAFFNGKISDVHVYSRTLTPTEVTALANREDNEAGPGQRGLAGAWSLADGAAQYAADSSGNYRNGTTSTTMTWTADHGGSAQFDGATNAIQATVMNASTNYTVAAWVKLNATGSTQTALGYDGTNVSGFSLRYDASANRWAMAAPASDTTGAATTSVTSTSAPAVGVWTHLAGVYDAGARQLRLYVNGQPAGSAAYTAPTLPWGALTIGRGKAGGAAAQFFNGRISGVQAYQTALSASQIGTLYAGGSLLRPTTTLTTSWTLDQRGLPTSVTDPRGNTPGATKANYTTNFTYDEADQLATVVKPVVNAESGGGAATPVHPITMVGHNTFGEETEVQDPNGNITVTSYDRDGRPTGATLPSYTPPGSSTPIHATTSVAYNDLGQATTTTDPLGNQTGYVYDQLGNLVTSTDPPIGGAATGGLWRYTYDTNGERLSTTDPTGAREEATYDYLGHQITGTQLVRQPAGGATLAYTTNFGYNVSGDLTSITSPTGVTTSATFDNAGEMTASTDGAGNTTNYAYANGRLISTTAPDGTTRTRDYDLSGNLTALTDLDAAGNPLRSAGIGYDAAGNPTSITDPTGVTVQLGYDATNRIVSQVEPVTATTNITTTFGYDAAGNRTRVTDGNNHPWLTTYNSWGLPESQIDPATPAYPNLADRTYTIGYDGAAQPVAVTQPGGVTRTRTYDALGNLTRETGAGAESSTTQRDFGYDKAGRLTSAGGNTFTYDDRGLLTASSGPSGNSSFTYDGDGQLTARTDVAGTTHYTYDDGLLATLSDPITGSTATYGYNTLGQVSGVTYGTGTGNGNRAYTYDDLHRLTGDRLATSTNATVSTIGYGYDLADRETSKTTTGFTGASANTYTYDQAGRLATWSNGASTTAYNYDQAGNRTGIGARTLTYNPRGQLLDDAVNTYAYTARGTPKTRTPKAGGSAVQTTSDAFDQLITDGRVTGGYTYDALGRLTNRGGTTFAYTGRGNDLASDGAATYSRDPANGLVGANLSGTGVLVDTDLRGDVVSTHTPAATGLSSSVTYDPLGNRIAGTGQRLGYQSGYTDPGTGQVNMAARWYSPDTGQFTSRDTVTNSPTPVSANANRYTYANNNPLTGTDPTGHWCFTCVLGVGAIGAAIGAVAGAVVGAAAGCLATVVVGCVGGAVVGGAVLGSEWGAVAGVTAGAAYDIYSNAGTSSYAGSSTYGGPHGGTVPYPGHTLGGGAIGNGLGLGGHVYPPYVFPPIFHWVWVPPPPPPTPAEYANMFAAHPVTPVLGVGSGIVYSPVITAPVTTVVTLPATPDTMFTPSDVAATTLVASGVVAGGTGITATPIPPHLPNQPSALDLFNTTTTANDLMQCDNLAECAMAALGLVPGEALLGHQASHSGTSLPDFALSCTHSFPGETRVLMADGTTKAIKDVKVGDQVANAQPSGRTEAHRVDEVHVTSTDTEFTDLTVTTPQGTRTIISTQNHPYWDATTHQFVTAAHLHLGDTLQTDGGTAIVHSVRDYTTTAVTYDLTVNAVHTYYVLAGAAPVLVHNCDPVPNSKWYELSVDLLDAQFQGVSPMFAGSDDFVQAMAGDGRYLWALDETGRLGIVSAQGGIKHSVITEGASVLGAGQLIVRNGFVTSFDNLTGHYTPRCECSRTFLQYGSDAFLKAGIRIPLRSWKDYGGVDP